MQRFIASLAASTLLVIAAPFTSAEQAPSVSCKKVKQALHQGLSIDEIIVDLDTDAAHIAQCMQKRGHRRAAPKEKKQAAAHARHKSAKASSTHAQRAAAQKKSHPPAESSAASRKAP